VSRHAAEDYHEPVLENAPDPAAPPTRAELEARLQQQALLAEIGRRALADPAPDILLGEAARLTALGLRTRYCKVLEYLPDRNRLLVRAGVGWHAGVVGHATIGAELDSPAGYALHTGKPVISNNLSSEHRFRTPTLLLEHGVVRAANVILLGEGCPFGVLEVDSEEPGAYSEHDIDFLQGVANLLGIALKRSQAEAALRELNETLESRVEAAVAERRLTEDVLRQAQKMEAVGQLTGGVAHDFNNLLLVISGNLELLARELTGNERLERMVATAQKGAARGAQLTRQLLAFARRQALRPENRQVNELVREFDVLATRMLGDAVEVAFELDQTAGAIDVDSAQFGSALLNLVVNARDAMPSGGRLTISTMNQQLDRYEAARHTDGWPGDFVVVEVTDTGTGMPPDVLERATEPFFTTKAPGHGTGLGLSQVYGFVRQSGGFMSLSSEPAAGTTVRIYLPLASARARARPSLPGAPKTGSGTVLVVEDDADVRDLVLAQLEDLGYDVVAAANGPEALAILDKGAPAIDLLLTDVIMPGGLSGVELVQAARQRRPGLRAALTSGYLAGNMPGSSTSDEIESLDLPLLSKPYGQDELARVLKEAFGADELSSSH
jgi:signal transduction histidine kinase/ActR/RegA family two-component response regulator